MRSTFAGIAFAALAAANPMPQGVTSAISPSSSPLPGCSTSHSGNFEIQVLNVTSSSKRDVEKRQTDSTLVMSLSNGVLKDSKGRTGYIAANRQFQFDAPPQTGAIYTSGWSVCSNGSLAIGANPIFYQCLSGTFYNLYDQNTSAQCNAVHIQVISGASATSGVASQTADGQVTGSAVSSRSAVSQISDGQIQATTGTAGRVTQISDGQIQATTGTVRPVSQISDGQIQATTGTARPVSQISDGQIQATTGTARPVSQISDGQIQATTGTARPVSQISDGQIQASTAARNGSVATATASVQAFTGAAAPTAIRGEFFGLAAGILAVAML